MPFVLPADRRRATIYPRATTNVVQDPGSRIPPPSPRPSPPTEPHTNQARGLKARVESVGERFTCTAPVQLAVFFSSSQSLGCVAVKTCNVT
ncbi:hypothetical protein EYF80_052982 [Liparis tanakae]|uniref:Uncharacterized protein n=1 Tax=Liparis tanakae TaxID=230148 RepID=A0A4Z2F959_9TELE|nr:hypothetical protein EYF80_052982 [Liparis tanakae]